MHKRVRYCCCRLEMMMMMTMMTIDTMLIIMSSYFTLTYSFGFNLKTYNYLQSQRTCGTRLYTSSPSTAFESLKWDLRLTSPCKLNLFLRIISRRPNGYHDLASLFQTISLADTLYMSKIDTEVKEDEIYCSDKSLSVDKSNLVVKALDLMRKKTNKTQYFRVYLDKIVPMQAGLGGGSSNAATAMHGFNVLCGYPATTQDMLTWSADIGSDISFFFSSGTAYCTGRGEIVDSLPALHKKDDVEVHVFKPQEGLSTALVFKAMNLSACSGIIPESLLDCFQTDGALAAASNGRLVNDLEAPAFSLSPLLLRLKQDILQYENAVSGVMMSGSGTSVFALRDKSNPNPFPAEEISRRFPGLRHFKCSFVSRANDLISWY